MRLALDLSLSARAVLQGAGNPAAFAGGEALPAGYHWEFVTDDNTGEIVRDEYFNNEPVVDYVRNA